MAIGGVGPRRSGEANTGRNVTGADTRPPFPIEEVQHADGRISTARVADAAQAEKVAQPTKPSEIKKQDTIARKWTAEDLADILVKNQKSPTTENKKMLSTLLQYGLEASGQNLDLIDRLTQGRTQANAIESSVISILKGVSDTPKSVDIVSKFLDSQLQAGKSLEQLQAALFQFAKAWPTLKGALSPGLHSGVADIVNQIEKNLKKLTQKNAEGKLALVLVNQGKVISDFHLFAGFIAGLQGQLDADHPHIGNALKEMFAKLKEASGKFIENLTSQAILSKSNASHAIGMEEFSYWQIPNPFAQNKKSIEIMIKKDPHKRDNKRKFDEKSTKVVVKCETEDIGELAIIVEIKGQKVWYVFYTDHAQTKKVIAESTNELKNNLEAHNYELVGVQTVPKKINLKKMLLPTFNLDRLTRIVTEV